MPAYLLFSGLCATLELLLGHHEGQGHCSGLNKTGPHRLIYLIALSLVGRAVQDGVGGMVLLEVCVTGVGL